MSKLTFLIGLSSLLVGCVVSQEKAVYAINLGGNAATGSDGIEYQADLRDHRKIIWQEKIDKLEVDQIYGSVFNDFILKLELPIAENGIYTLNLKFFEDNQYRQMDVQLNRQHKILDKFKVSDYAELLKPYDRYVRFNVENGWLNWNYELSKIEDKKILFELSGNEYPYGQISAIVLFWRPFNFETTTTQPPPIDIISTDQQILLKFTEIQNTLIGIDQKLSKIKISEIRADEKL